jgi:integrase/recombinase XerD
LFPNIYGEQLSQAALINTIKRYNNSRGVENTSLHSFRHTFAKMYLLDCGGDAIRLQKILGHKTLVMTKRYCNLYDQDIKRDFDRLSPLTRVSPNKPTIKKNK